LRNWIYVKIFKFPLTRIFIGFISGLLLSRIFNVSAIFAFTALAIVIIGLATCFIYIRKHPQLQNLFGILIIAASVISGITTSIIRKENRNPIHYTNLISDYDRIHSLDLLMIEKLKSTVKNQRFICRVKTLDGKTGYGKILLNIPKGQTIPNMEIGRHLLVSGIISRNKSLLNPNLFDYSRYLENQEIYAQVFSKHTVPGRYEGSIWAGFANFRERVISNLKHSQIPKEELNVLNALILGQQQDISPGLLKDYQYAGAVHVLSVSGLHVGFILLFITYLLKPVGNSRKGSFIKLCLILMSLWSFALLAGLAPSIVRSVTMFSFVAIGTHLRRITNIYYTLIVSMLLILLFKPSFLFDVGFQLSYLALFFIIWLQPVLAGIWEPKNRIMRYLWDIITVSFAAQIGTMPLSIYYFHQFPGLFFVTNLMILPLLGIIMAVGVITTLTAIFTKVPLFIAKTIGWLIQLLNTIIHQVASLDSFVIRNIPFSKEMLIGSYLSIILVIVWVKKPNFGKSVFAFLGILLIQGIFIYQKKETFSKAELIVFNNKKNTIITERNGNQVTVYSNDSILNTLDNNLLLQSYTTGNFCWIKSKRPLQNLMYFKGQKILIIDNSGIYQKAIRPDILIIIQAPKLNLERLLRFYKPKEIVVDGSNFKSYTRLWEATCRKEKIPFHYTNEKGFYKI